MSAASDHEMSTSFGRATTSYGAGRPGYPLEAIEWMLQPARHTPGAGQRRDEATRAALRVADVGAGTGKLTRTLIASGVEVVAVDPDAAMLGALIEAMPGVPTLVGTAEALPLPEASVDAVVLGQAWHWVEPRTGSAEAARVLRSGGVLGLVWNIRDGSVPWVTEMTEIMHGSNAEALIAEGGPRVDEPFGALEATTFEWSRPMTAGSLLDMARSRSYLITASDTERARIEAALLALFDELPELRDGGSIALPYVTHAFRAVRP